MTAKESAICAQLQDFGYSQGLILTAMRILRQSKAAQEEVLLYLYDNQPTEKEFIEHLAGICEGSIKIG